MEWLFTLFAKALPAPVTAWILDQLFVGGESVLLAAAIGILQVRRCDVLCCDVDTAVSTQTHRLLTLACQLSCVPGVFTVFVVVH